MKRTDKSIKSIYEGLPKELAEKVLRVNDEFRTNPLSLKPGGVDIVVEYTTGDVLLYDKIKYPDRYVKRILSFTTNAEISAENIESLVHENLKKVFVKDGVYIEIWNSSMSYDELITSLSKYSPHPNAEEIRQDDVWFSERRKLSTEKLSDDWTYISLGTYKGFTFLVAFRRLIKVTLDETNPINTISILCKVTELKSESDKRPFIVDLKELYDNVDEILDDDHFAMLYKGNNTSRLRFLSNYIFYESEDLIVFKENSNERIELLRFEDDGGSQSFVYIEGEFWTIAVDDVIILN